MFIHAVIKNKMKNKDLIEPQINFSYQLTVRPRMAETFHLLLILLFAWGWLLGDSNNSWCGPQCVVLNNHITINIRNCYSRAITFVVLPHKPKLEHQKVNNKGYRNTT